MNDLKPFKTFEEQIQILKDRGLIIANDEIAVSLLQHINYYRLSGYTLTLRKNDVFYRDTYLENILELYNFDSELRTLLLHLLEYVEVSFRTHIAYHHAEKYGSTAYLDSVGFINPEFHKQFILELRKIIEEQDKNEVFIKHYKDKYNGTFPIWVAVELLSFGSLSKLFKNSVEDIKKEISQKYYGIPYEYIEAWLHGLAIIRNICAHRGRLYNRPITIKPLFSPKDNKLGIRKDRVFAYLFVLKKLIKDDNIWANFLENLKEILEKHRFVLPAHLGFPDNWIELLKRE